MGKVARLPGIGEAARCPLLDRDPEAWLRCCTARFLPMARRIAGDDATAQDALQDSWIIVLEKLYQYRGAPPACGWVGTIVRHEAGHRASVRRIECSRRQERRGLWYLEGEAVAGADAEQVYVAVDLAADLGSRATEETATGRNAAPAEAAPQVDSGEQEQPADEMATTTARVPLGSVCVHDTLLLCRRESEGHAITVPLRPRNDGDRRGRHRRTAAPACGGPFTGRFGSAAADGLAGR